MKYFMLLIFRCSEQWNSADARRMAKQAQNFVTSVGHSPTRRWWPLVNCPSQDNWKGSCEHSLHLSFYHIPLLCAFSLNPLGFSFVCFLLLFCCFLFCFVVVVVVFCLFFINLSYTY